MWKKAAHQGSSNSLCTNSIWGNSSVVPALFRLSVRGRKTNHGMADRQETAAGYNAGASVLVCYLGKPSALSSSGDYAGRSASHLHRQSVPRYTAAAHADSWCTPRSASQRNTTGQSQGANPFERSRVSVWQSTELMCEPIG